MQAAAATFVTHRDGAFILVRRAVPGPGQGTWSCSGGKIEDGETWRDCGVRETREELGLLIAAPRLIAVTTAAGWLTAWTTSAWLGGEVTLNQEADDWRWAHPSPDSAGRLPLWTEHWGPLLSETGGWDGLRAALAQVPAQLEPPTCQLKAG